jgi:hypothetical protein
VSAKLGKEALQAVLEELGFWVRSINKNGAYCFVRFAPVVERQEWNSYSLEDRSHGAPRHIYLLRNTDQDQEVPVQGTDYVSALIALKETLRQMLRVAEDVSNVVVEPPAPVEAPSRRTRLDSSII